MTMLFKRKKINALTSPKRDPTSIGNLVVQSGFCTREEFDTFLGEFQSLEVGQLLGQFLIAKGVMSEEQLEMLLIRQQTSRTGLVNHEQVMRAMNVASRTQEKLDNGVASLSAATAKVSGK